MKVRGATHISEGPALHAFVLLSYRFHCKNKKKNRSALCSGHALSSTSTGLRSMREERLSQYRFPFSQHRVTCLKNKGCVQQGLSQHEGRMAGTVFQERRRVGVTAVVRDFPNIPLARAVRQTIEPTALWFRLENDPTLVGNC